MEVQTPKAIADQAKSAYEQGDYQAAARGFADAAEGYQLQEDPLMTAEMRNNQSVAALLDKNPQAALEAVEGTEIIFKQAGERLKLAMAYGNRAAALEALDRLEEAENNYHQSAELLKEMGETDLYAQIMKSLSALLMRVGRQHEALAAMQSGMDELERPSAAQRFLKKLLNFPSKFLRN